MTIGASPARVSFNCDGVTTVFPVPIQAYQATDLTAVLTAPSGSGGAETTLVLNSDYSLVASSTDQPPKWTLTTLHASAYAAGYTLQVFSNPVQSQPTQYVQGQAFPSLAVQTNLDRLTQMVQRLQDQVSRAVRAPDGDVSPLMVLPVTASRLSQALMLDANGNITVGVPNTQVITTALLAPFLNLAQTPAESTAGVTPTNLADSPYIYNLARIGLVPNSTAAATANRTALRALFNPANTGPVGQFFFPNTTGADIYYIDGVIPCRDGIHLDLNGCNIQLGTSGTPAVAGGTGPNDSNSGVFFALHDLVVENGVITVWWNTGSQSGSGCGLQAGQRPTGNGYITFPTGEASLASRMARFTFRNLRIFMNVTGGAAANSVAGITILGGVQNTVIENVGISGGNTLSQGITYEFGFATVPGGTSSYNASVQSSHANGLTLRNIAMQAFAPSGTVQGITVTGAYNVTVDGFYCNGVLAPIVVNVGEATFYNPWVNADDAGAKHNTTLRNLVLYVPANQNAISLTGAQQLKNGGAYVAWKAANVYNPGDIVFQDPNLYTCATAIASATTAPVGTGAGIVDGGGTWNWLPTNIPFSGAAANSAWGPETDLHDVVIENFSIYGTGQRTTGGATPGSYGIYNFGASRLRCRNGTIQYVERGIVSSQESTHVVLEDLRILNNWFFGVRFDNIAGGALWSPARAIKAEIRNCYIAGNSRNAAGSFSGIEFYSNIDSALVENCRFGYETNYAGFNDATQAGGVYVNSALANIICRGNRCAPPAGGGKSYWLNTVATNGCIVQNASGDTSTSGGWITDFASAVAQSITANGQTINTQALRFIRVTTTGAFTGIILQGANDYRSEITVINESANAITFAASGTSNVADGVADVIPALTARKFNWDNGTNLWYRAA